MMAISAEELGKKFAELRKQNSLQKSLGPALGGQVISMVRNATETKTRDITVEKVLEAIRTGGTRLKGQITQIRNRFEAELAFTGGDRKAAKRAVEQLKKSLSAVMWCGQFSNREHPAADKLQEHSGLFIADLDGLGDKLPEIRKKLEASRHVFAFFLSPTGDGLKVVISVPADVSKHAGSFRAVQKHVLEQTGIKVDESGKDPARLCFMSYDPELYVNVNAREIQPLPEPEKPAAPFNANREVNLSERQRIATERLGAIDWQSETSGYCTCPGKHLHTTGDGERDCELHLDNAPTVHCFHDHCRGMVDAVNRELRSRIGKAEFVPTPTVEAQPANSGPFPLHCLPPACEAMARAICETVRVRESLPGCSILGISSAAIGKGLQVKSGANRVTRGNLYILPSAESGSGKSETSRHAAKPFLDFEAERLKAWKVETLPGLLAERDILQSEIDNLKKQAGQADDAVERGKIRSRLEKKKAALEEIEMKLRAPVLSCEDITSQKLAELLAHNAEQLASLSADAGEIVNVLLGRYNKLDRTDASVYLKAFTGDYCTVDRKNSEPVLLQSPCLSALWLTQPDKLESLLAERSLSDGGLIPRILTCHTHCDAREIVKDAPEIPASVENDYRNLIRTLIETYRLADEPFTIEPTSDALEALNAHYNGIVKRRRTDLRDVTIYAARWNEQAWRIAVVLHAATHGAHAHEYKLELDTAKRAIELADWFAGQQLEILSARREKARREIWDEVLSLLADRPEGIRASDIYRARIVRNADEAHTLLAEMERAGELIGRDEHPESGGHVTRIFTRVRK